MKKLIALLMAVVLCLSLCACGNTKLTVAEVEDALADCDGTLNLDTSGDSVTGFTYKVEDVNADDLTDKSYVRDSVTMLLNGNAQDMTYGQYKVARAAYVVVAIEVLFEGNNADFNADAFTEKTLGIICDGNTVKYDNWHISADIDTTNDCMTISVVSK